jgi:hypothetical protein
MTTVHRVIYIPPPPVDELPEIVTLVSSVLELLRIQIPPPYPPEELPARVVFLMTGYALPSI